MVYRYQNKKQKSDLVENILYKDHEVNAVSNDPVLQLVDVLFSNIFRHIHILINSIFIIISKQMKIFVSSFSFILYFTL
jgi:hypothetical protein